jgi:hypothetical protein
MILLIRNERLQGFNPSQITTLRKGHQRWEWAFAYYSLRYLSYKNQLFSNPYGLGLVRKPTKPNPLSSLFRMGAKTCTPLHSIIFQRLFIDANSNLNIYVWTNSPQDILPLDPLVAKEDIV